MINNEALSQLLWLLNFLNTKASRSRLAVGAVSLGWLVASATVVPAQQIEDAFPEDLQAIEDQGVPTIGFVAALRTQAFSAYNAGNCNEALPLLDEFATAANLLANLITAGLEPFYGASVRDRDDFRAPSDLVLRERQSNDLKRNRNTAMVMSAECELVQGNTDRAVSLLTRVLDLIGISESELWERARSDLWSILGIEEYAVTIPGGPLEPAAEAIPPEGLAPQSQISAPAEDVASIVAAGDPIAGEADAAACRGCHTFDEGGLNLVGPNLFGVMGREVASVEEFTRYSDAIIELRDSGAVWTADLMDAFLEDPQAYSAMPFAGVSDAEQRTNIIAYLATLAPAEEEAAVEEPAEEVAEEAPAVDLAPVSFNAQQVSWGVMQYAAECAHCHGENLEGGDAVALASNAFEESWFGRRLGDLYTAMRYGETHRGDLSNFDYVALIALILSANGFEPQASPLSPVPSTLDGVGIFK